MMKAQSRLKPVLRAGLSISGDAAGVVIGHHGDDAGPQHRQQDQPAALGSVHPVNALADPVHESRRAYDFGGTEIPWKLPASRVRKTSNHRRNNRPEPNRLLKDNPICRNVQVDPFAGSGTVWSKKRRSKGKTAAIPRSGYLPFSRAYLSRLASVKSAFALFFSPILS